jgi:hypothetical protein
VVLAGLDWDRTVEGEAVGAAAWVAGKPCVVAEAACNQYRYDLVAVEKGCIDDGSPCPCCLIVMEIHAPVTLTLTASETRIGVETGLGCNSG